MGPRAVLDPAHSRAGAQEANANAITFVQASPQSPKQRSSVRLGGRHALLSHVLQQPCFIECGDFQVVELEHLHVTISLDPN